jgi:hypothetical protein
MDAPLGRVTMSSIWSLTRAAQRIGSSASIVAFHRLSQLRRGPTEKLHRHSALAKLARAGELIVDLLLVGDRLN